MQSRARLSARASNCEHGQQGAGDQAGSFLPAIEQMKATKEAAANDIIRSLAHRHLFLCFCSWKLAAALPTAAAGKLTPADAWS